MSQVEVVSWNRIGKRNRAHYFRPRTGRIGGSAIIFVSSAASRARNLARDRHLAGLTGFIDVLEADRALLLTEDACVQSRTQLTLNLVRLYKALGGGWQD